MVQEEKTYKIMSFLLQKHFIKEKVHVHKQF